MKRLAVIAVVLGCASKDAAKIPDDHQIHRTETADRTVIAGKAVDLTTVPVVAETLSLPVSGTVDVDIDLKAAVKAGARDYEHANGHIVLHCTSCRIGDDKAMIEPKGRASAFGPLYVGHVDFGSIDVDVQIVDGKATVKTFTVASNDLEIKVDGGATLAPKLEDMRVDLCLRFKPTDALVARDPKTNALLNTTGAPLGGDGFFNMRLTDRLSSLKRLGTVCDGSAPASPPPDLQRPTLPDPAAAVTPLDPKDIAGAIKKIDATHYDVDRTLFDKLLANPTAIASGGRVVPAIRDGKPDGFKLFALKADSLFVALGLQNGDTIRSLGGMPLASADKALDAYQHVRDMKVGETITVELTRADASVTLSYKLR